MRFGETPSFGQKKAEEIKKPKKGLFKKLLPLVAAGLVSHAAEAKANDISGTAEKMGGNEKVMKMTAEDLSALQGESDFVEKAGGFKVRIAEGVKSEVVKNFNSLSNEIEAPEKGLAQEILSGRDAGFFENLSKLYPNWEEKPIGSVVSLLNKNLEIEVEEKFNSKAVEAAKKLNILCGGFQKYKTLGEAVEVASENSKKMDIYLSSSEIESVLSAI